jgi:hypothetical protein
MPVCRSAHLLVRRRSSSGRVVDVTVELDLEAATSCAAVRVDLSLRRRSGERGTRRRLSPSPGSAEPRVCCQVSLSKHRPGQPVTPRWWTGRPVVGHRHVDPRVIGPEARRPDHRTHLECPTVGEPHRRIAGVHRTAVELHAMPPSERPGARAHERLPPGHPVAQLRLLRRADEEGLVEESEWVAAQQPLTTHGDRAELSWDRRTRLFPAAAARKVRPCASVIPRTPSAARCVSLGGPPSLQSKAPR